MKEMIQARKEELQKRGVSGFTLMEMLIVVAIIAVLVAIAIPVMTAQLNNAKAETDAANIRSGYASANVEILNGSTATTFGLNKDGSVTVGGAGTYTCAANANDLNDKTQSIGGTAASAIGWTANGTITYTWADDTMTITATKAS